MPSANLEELSGRNLSPYPRESPKARFQTRRKPKKSWAQKSREKQGKSTRSRLPRLKEKRRPHQREPISKEGPLEKGKVPPNPNHLKVISKTPKPFPKKVKEKIRV